MITACTPSPRRSRTIGGVSDVVVDLGTGQLVVISETEIPYAVVAAAVDEAGYSLTAG